MLKLAWGMVETQLENDLEYEGSEISENIRSSDAYDDDDNGYSGNDRDELDTGRSKSPRTNEEKSEYSHDQVAGAVPMNSGRSGNETLERLVGLFREFFESASNPDPGTPNNNNSNPPHHKRNITGRKKVIQIIDTITSRNIQEIGLRERQPKMLGFG